jgi:signal transduction histidine kinase
VAHPELQATSNVYLAPAASARGLLRLALDLHDGPLQDLIATGFALDRLLQDVDRLPEQPGALIRMQVESIREHLGEVESGLRALAELHNAQAHDGTLAHLVSDELDRFRVLDDIDVDIELDVDPTIEPETDSQRIALHRVLREALTNVAKHAQAQHVRVALTESENVIYLRVSDDGVGFDPEAERHGMGLSGMHDRLRLLGSSMRIESRPGGPTTIMAAVRRWRPD